MYFHSTWIETTSKTESIFPHGIRLHSTADNHPHRSRAALRSAPILFNQLLHFIWLSGIISTCSICIYSFHLTALCSKSPSQSIVAYSLPMPPIALVGLCSSPSPQLFSIKFCSTDFAHSPPGSQHRRQQQQRVPWPHTASHRRRRRRNPANRSRTRSQSLLHTITIIETEANQASERDFS